MLIIIIKKTLIPKMNKKEKSKRVEKIKKIEKITGKR